MNTYDSMWEKMTTKISINVINVRESNKIPWGIEARGERTTEDVTELLCKTTDSEVFNVPVGLEDRRHSRPGWLIVWIHHKYPNYATTPTNITKTVQKLPQTKPRHNSPQEPPPPLTVRWVWLWHRRPWRMTVWRRAAGEPGRSLRGAGQYIVGR